MSNINFVSATLFNMCFISILIWKVWGNYNKTTDYEHCISEKKLKICRIFSRCDFFSPIPIHEVKMLCVCVEGKWKIFVSERNSHIFAGCSKTRTRKREGKLKCANGSLHGPRKSSREICSMNTKRSPSPNLFWLSSSRGPSKRAVPMIKPPLSWAAAHCALSWRRFVWPRHPAGPNNPFWFRPGVCCCCCHCCCCWRRPLWRLCGVVAVSWPCRHALIRERVSPPPTTVGQRNRPIVPPRYPVSGGDFFFHFTAAAAACPLQLSHLLFLARWSETRRARWPFAHFVVEPWGPDPPLQRAGYVGWGGVGGGRWKKVPPIFSLLSKWFFFLCRSRFEVDASVCPIRPHLEQYETAGL